jgi:hypothetical protein
MEASHAKVAEPEAQATRAPRNGLRVFAVLFVAFAAFAGGAMATCGYHVLTQRAAPAKPAASTVVRGTSTVITAIRDLAVLQTSSYYVERVIDLKDKQSHMFGLVESEDAILLVAAGEVTAGVDLSTLRDGDVSFDPEGQVAYISLPAASILSARLDNDRTYVHTRKTDALAQRAETLETRARQEAESTLREAAVTGGILERANKNAMYTLETLLRGLGFTRVVITARTE